MRILIADDQEPVRRALEMLLKQEPGLTLVGETSEAGSLLAVAPIIRPDLVLLDWELPGRPAVDVLSALQALEYRPRVIVFSSRPEAEQAALAAGADAFVSKGDPPERLLATLHCSAQEEGRVRAFPVQPSQVVTESPA